MLSSRHKYDGIPTRVLSSTQLLAKKRVENKISTGIYTFQTVNCPVCETCDYELLSQKDRYGLPVTTVICKKCGLLITNPMMTQDSLNKFYADDFAELYRDQKSATSLYFDKRYNYGKSIIKYIEKHANISINNKSVLDVGCGAGGILLAFREKGANVVGIDLNADYLEYGIKKHNLNLKNMSLSDYIENMHDGGGRGGNIIIYSHVLEHIQNLQNELSLIKKICHEKTLIYVEVPGLLSVHKNYGDFLLYLQNAHIYHFSLGTLLNVLQKNGFSLVYGDEYIHSLFMINNQFQTDNKNYYKTNISYLKRLEFLNRYFPIFNKRYLSKYLIKILKKIHLYNKVKEVYYGIINK